MRPVGRLLEPNPAKFFLIGEINNVQSAIASSM
jgi:hypothetical protein